MKKIVLLFVLFLAMGVCFTVFASYIKKEESINPKNKEIISTNSLDKDFEILPTMDYVSKAKNQVWVGTFQLVWNDLTDEIIKHPIEFVNYSSVMADKLNAKSFGVEDLSESSYYKKWGLASPQMKTEIENGIKAKFNETSDILDSMDWTPEEDKYILYAMLKKDFQFIEKFTKLENGYFNGSSKEVKYFGLDENSTYAQRRSIDVLFYTDQNNFAVKLKSKQGDNVYLYRTNEDKTLDSYYKDILNKEKKFKGENYISEEDEFKAPLMDFKSERHFKELCNKPIKYSKLIISDAIETIQFKMDEAGVKLKSEAAIETKRAIMSVNSKQRYFYFNDKFVMFIAENGKKPYFAMKVSDAKKLQ